MTGHIFQISYNFVWPLNIKSTKRATSPYIKILTYFCASHIHIFQCDMNFCKRDLYMIVLQPKQVRNDILLLPWADWTLRPNNSWTAVCEKTWLDNSDFRHRWALEAVWLDNSDFVQRWAAVINTVWSGEQIVGEFVSAGHGWIQLTVLLHLTHQRGEKIVFVFHLIWRLVRTGHKVLTYIEYKAVSGVFRTIEPPPLLHPVSVSSPAPGGGYTLAGRWGGGGSIFQKTPDIGLASYSIIPLRYRSYIGRSPRVLLSS